MRLRNQPRASLMAFGAYLEPGLPRSPAPLGIRGEILLGALLPITGELSVLGTRSRVAAEIAIYDLNSYVKALGLPITFKLLVEDSATDPTTALNKLQSLYARGVRAVVGPMASAEVRNVKSYADGNKIVMCSPSSTAPDLAVPDYIFRDIPNDRYQGRAIARLMYDYGIRYVYILYRNDAWGKGLADATEARFKEIGGTVLANAGYDPKKSDFTPYLGAAASTIRDAIGKYGASKVGVLLLSFEEGGAITAQASGYPELMGVTWFGSDGTALNSKILEQAGAQLAKVKHLATMYSPTASPKLLGFVDKFRSRAGEYPDAFSVNAYDCVWMLGLTIIYTGKYDGEAIKNALPHITKIYFGASGWALLDENGDRVGGGSYEVWAVVLEGDRPRWEKVAIVNLDSDNVSWIRRI
jgi:branched-chain amino acid transport system substrate-binding protein